MAQSLSNVLVHFVFSTKNRQPWITEEFQPDMAAYIAGLFRNHDCHLLIVNAVPDHVHSLAALSRTHSISDIMEAVKGVRPAGSRRRIPDSIPSSGRTAMGLSRSARPRRRSSAGTWPISGSTTGGSVSRRNTGACWSGMGCHTKSGISGSRRFRSPRQGSRRKMRR